MADYECIRLEKKDYVGHLILSRPDKRNRMNLKFFEEMVEVFERIDEDYDVRSVLISAEGKSFTAGLDLAEAATLFTDPTAKSRHDFKKVVMRLQESMNVIDRCRKPVIVAIHSHCIGGGVDMATASDIRLASQDAVFSIRETRMAMVADLGTLQRIGAIIGQGWTRELALTGRDFDASQALGVTLADGNLEREARAATAGSPHGRRLPGAPRGSESTRRAGGDAAPAPEHTTAPARTLAREGEDAAPRVRTRG